MARKRKFKTSSVEQSAEAFAWMQNNKESLPDFVLSVIEDFSKIVEELKETESKRSNLLTQLRLAIGISPSSERKRKRSEKNQEDKKSVLIQDKDHHKNRADWHKKQWDKHKRMAKDIDKKIKSIDDVILSEQDILKVKKEVERDSEILESGGDPDPSLMTPKEALMSGIGAQLVFEEVKVSLDTNEDYKNKFFETRTRYDFDFQIAEIQFRVEKGQDASGTIVSGSTHEFGPKNFQVTWGFLANMTMLVTQYAVPFERLARLLSTREKKFSSSHMCRFFSYVAQHLLPIYLHLSKQLSKCDFLSGDDTIVRVVEANKALEENTRPWNHYATEEIAEKTLSENENPKGLGVKIAAELGFEFSKKAGDGPKRQIKTTVILGKTDSKVPESYIAFYRTHFGNFGNLLDILLLNRPKQNKKLWIQSDLSTANLVSEPMLLENFDFTLFGCASHARRPFAIHEDLDPLCPAILCLFGNIYHLEKSLDVWGRNQTNVFQLRQQSAKYYWGEMYKLCEQLCERWSPATALGTAARYIIKHYKKLTAYLEHPSVSLSNDFSERMLRMEKVIQANSLFRNSLEGRFALDICRTVVQTALIAGVDVKEYLLYVLKQKNLKEHTEHYTPFAFFKKNN